jgi:hypothetical protein
MRRRSLALVVAVPLAFALAAAARPRAPHAARIVAACNPSGNAHVEPERVNMKRQDHVEWREQTGRATAWVITPKDPDAWPFADTIRGNQDAPAATALPADDAEEDLVYEYMVTITCRDGSTQVIDPEIVIGAN